jgi:hypothetical protein
MSEVDTRNLKARAFVKEWLDRGRDFKPPKPLSDELTEAKRVLDNLIPINSKGFRGVVLTAIVGQYLDEKYQPLIDFYSCSPRAIFEQGIYYALQEAQIPCGKSDPLNVAKNIQKLDYDWAKGRRPEPAARAVVDFLRMLDAASEDPLLHENLLLLYFHELYSYGQLVKSLHIQMTETDKAVPIDDAQKFAKLSVECPEGGSVPQFIVGSLISLLREGDLNTYKIVGHEESVFGTNTTSKKPADIWEVHGDGTLGALYEITVKGIDFKRLDDCVDALTALNVTDPVVTFVCRLPHDITSLSLTHPFTVFRGVRFQFLDITQFIYMSYCLLNEEQRIRLKAKMNTFIADVNRSVATKVFWNEHVSAQT